MQYIGKLVEYHQKRGLLGDLWPQWSFERTDARAAGHASWWATVYLPAFDQSFSSQYPQPSKQAAKHAAAAAAWNYVENQLSVLHSRIAASALGALDTPTLGDGGRVEALNVTGFGHELHQPIPAAGASGGVRNFDDHAFPHWLSHRQDSSRSPPSSHDSPLITPRGRTSPRDDDEHAMMTSALQPHSMLDPTRAWHQDVHSLHRPPMPSVRSTASSNSDNFYDMRSRIDGSDWPLLLSLADPLPLDAVSGCRRLILADLDTDAHDPLEGGHCLCRGAGLPAVQARHLLEPGTWLLGVSHQNQQQRSAYRPRAGVGHVWRLLAAAASSGSSAWMHTLVVSDELSQLPAPHGRENCFTLFALCLLAGRLVSHTVHYRAARVDIITAPSHALAVAAALRNAGFGHVLVHPCLCMAAN